MLVLFFFISLLENLMLQANTAKLITPLKGPSMHTTRFHLSTTTHTHTHKCMCMHTQTIRGLKLTGLKLVKVDIAKPYC